ncbi:hypothetical protein V6N13_142036 [Hibiscus sabdariffa]
MNAVLVRNQRHELTPPRDRSINSDQGSNLSGLRDRPVTQQDALSNSEVFPAKISVEAGPIVSAEASPLSSSRGRLSKQIHRPD